ncbi:MAG: lysophospholipid acyltransferase family protein [Thermodesulfobacteriota bacterium]
MKRLWKEFFYSCLIPYVALIAVKLLSVTFRVELIGEDREQSLIKKDGGIIYASWHQRFFPGIAFFAKRKPITIMISQSRDGEMAARVVDILGWQPVRGSSTRGGKEALAQIKQLSRSGYKIGHIVDGPQGPFGVVKAGLLRIAQVSGKAIVPTITSAEKRWVFNSWDRFMVPKPFSRVKIRFGDPIYVPDNLSADEFEQKRREIEQAMAVLYEDTDGMWPRPGRTYREKEVPDTGN